MPGMTRPTGAGGRMQVTFSHIAEQIIEARDTWPAALRVVYVGDTDTLTLAAPLDTTCYKTVSPFVNPVPNPEDVPTGETALRNYLEANLVQEKIWVSAYKGFIKSRLAPVGKHRFTLHQVRKFTRRSDGDERVGLTLRTTQGLEIGFTAPWPDIGAIRGATPDADNFEINDQKMGAKYLFALGLDLDKWEEEMGKAEALWPRPGVTSMFSDENDVTPEILQAVARHGPQAVQIEIVEDEKWGLGPLRKGQYHEVVMKIYATDDPVAHSVETVEKEPQSDFADELLYFTALYDSLTKLVSHNDSAEFTASGFLTEAGRDIAVMVIAPVVNEFPHVVKGKKDDGSPAIPFPITEEGWNLDGLHWLAELAARLIKNVDLSQLDGVVDRNDSTKIVEWAKENVPELTTQLEEIL